MDCSGPGLICGCGLFLSSLFVEHLAQLLGGFVQVLDGLLDRIGIFALGGLLEVVDGTLDFAASVARDLVAMLFQRLFRLVNDLVGLVLDIDDLSSRGLVERTYGGAAAPMGREPNIYERTTAMVSERQRIATVAIQAIAPGDVVMIDSGATSSVRRIRAPSMQMLNTIGLPILSMTFSYIASSIWRA